ncbi:hypothetical protein Droror1_Dr00023032 [Drosera rotundifolia]
MRTTVLYTPHHKTKSKPRTLYWRFYSPTTLDCLPHVDSRSQDDNLYKKANHFFCNLKFQSSAMFVPTAPHILFQVPISTPFTTNKPCLAQKPSFFYFLRASVISVLHYICF